MPLVLLSIGPKAMGKEDMRRLALAGGIVGLAQDRVPCSKHEKVERVRRTYGGGIAHQGMK